MQNPNLLNADHLSKISFEEFNDIFKGRGELLQMHERHKITQDNFKILINYFNGSAAHLVASAKKNANRLVEILVTKFPHFNDSAVYKGQNVYFYKLAQIFTSDISFALGGRGLGEFNNLQDLTAFADYKLPQLLQAEGVFEYNAGLMKKIQNEDLIPGGSQEEIEIRAGTLWACELLARTLSIPSRELDWRLWVLS